MKNYQTLHHGFKANIKDSLISHTRVLDPAAEAVDTALAKGSPKTWKEFLTANARKSVEDASSSYIKLINDEDPWPEGYAETASTTTIGPGTEFRIVMDESYNPIVYNGRFATFDNVPNVEYARVKMAIKEVWKYDCKKVVTYKVKPGINIEVIEGPIGPQIDLTADRYLPGGGSQINFRLDKSLKLIDYIDYVSETIIS